jgi:hypothetical protein
LRGSPRLVLARPRGNLVGCGIANPQELPVSRIDMDFEIYLKVQNKRNIKQILCYARRYHRVLETGDTTLLANLSAATGHHAMESLAILSKYNGYYDKWQEIRKLYSLKGSVN